MQQFFLILLIISGSFFIVQTILGLTGLSDFDVDVPTDGQGAGPFGFLTIRNMITFLLGFSATGYLLVRIGIPMVICIIASIVFGLILAASVIYLMRILVGLEQKNEIEPHEYRGLQAVVTVRVEQERQKPGKVEFSLHGRIDEMLAVTDEEEALLKGENVHVIKLLDTGTLLVKKILIN